MPQVTAGGIEFTYDSGTQGDKWFYHPDGQCRLAYEFEYKELYESGWCDTPDDFPSNDVEKTDIETWDKEKLIDYAFTMFGVKLKKNFSKENLIKQVKELEHGNVP